MHKVSIYCGGKRRDATVHRGSKFLRNRSFHRLQKLPCFAQQRLNAPSPGDRVLSEQAVPARVLVCPWRAGSRRTAVHAAALSAAHRRRAARSAEADFCAATRARQHRTGIAGSIAHACASRFVSRHRAAVRLDQASGPSRHPSPRALGYLSETITLACCVTLPTMALPPSPTDTFCTVMAGSPLLR